jgi:two-component system heavy metal sensor histidine kinase CusS
MCDALPPELFIPSAQLPDEQPRAIDHLTPSGRLYFLMAAWMSSPDEKGHRWLIQLAADRQDEQIFRRRFRATLLLVLLCGVGATVILSRMIVRHGLGSLGEVVTTMTRVKACRLDERIGGLGWPNELVGLAAAFDEMLNRLEDSFARLSRFSADLAHELRTPLFNMRGETEVALAKSRSPDEYRDVLESNLEEISRISQMIDSLLFLARAENPAARVELCAFDARSEVETIIEFHDAAAAEAGVEFIIQGEAKITADPILFRRAVSNLLSNALQHTASGGRITITLESDPDQVRLRVADTGTGIAPEHLPRLFDRFYRVDKSRHSGGTGLGLAIVKSIMQMHGGEVEITSKEGEGTTIVLSFKKA